MQATAQKSGLESHPQARHRTLPWRITNCKVPRTISSHCYDESSVSNVVFLYKEIEKIGHGIRTGSGTRDYIHPDMHVHTYVLHI